MSKIIRPLRSGQITIPADYRKRLGITEESLLQLSVENGELRLKPLRLVEQGENALWLKELYKRFAPVRDEAEESLKSEDIDAAIDQAVKAVRKPYGKSRL